MKYQVRVFSSFPMGLCLLLIVSGLLTEARQSHGRRFGQGRSRPSGGSTRGKRYLSQQQSHGSNYNRHWNNPFRTIQVANAANEKLFQYRGLRDITCVPAQMCQTMYGTSPEHFTQYGYVSPEQYNCLSLDGVTLCITDSNTNPTTTPVPTTTTTTTTSSSTYQLPCVEAYLCQVVFGTQSEHWQLFGYQKPCPKPSQKRCVVFQQTGSTTPSTTTTTTTTANPWWTPSTTTTANPWWTPSTTTSNPWWTPSTTTSNPWWTPSSTTSNPWWTPSTTTTNPWWTPTSTTSNPWWKPNPSQHASFGNVQLIGSKPMYVALSHVVGPQVTNHHPGSIVNNYGIGFRNQTRSQGRYSEYYRNIARGLISQHGLYEDQEDQDLSENSLSKWWKKKK